MRSRMEISSISGFMYEKRWFHLTNSTVFSFLYSDYYSGEINKIKLYVKEYKEYNVA